MVPSTEVLPDDVSVLEFGVEYGDGPPAERKVEHCLRVLRVLVPASVAGRSVMGSYGLKHFVEEVVREYIPNGAVIEACRRMGLPQTRDGINTRPWLTYGSSRAALKLMNAMRPNEDVVVVCPDGSEHVLPARAVVGWLLERGWRLRMYREAPRRRHRHRFHVGP